MLMTGISTIKLAKLSETAKITHLKVINKFRAKKYRMRIWICSSYEKHYLKLKYRTVIVLVVEFCFLCS